MIYLVINILSLVIDNIHGMQCILSRIRSTVLVGLMQLYAALVNVEINVQIDHDLCACLDYMAGTYNPYRNVFTGNI